MKTQRFFRRWQRQYQKLFDKQWTVLQQNVQTGTPKQVHELRVNLRRLRLMLRVAAPLLDEAAASEYQSWSRGILNATSQLRDYDAALEWLGEQNATTQTIRSIERHRHRLWRTAKTKIKEPSAKTRLRLGRFKLNHRGRIRLERRFWRQLSRLDDAVARSIPKMHELDPEERHSIRRKLRRIRYLLEICLPRRKLASDRTLKSINRLQTAMGELQNLINAARILSRVADSDVTPSLHILLSQQKSEWAEEIQKCSRVLARCRHARPPAAPPRNGAIGAAPSGPTREKT